MKKILLGNRELIRDINRAIVLNAIKTAGTISRVDLAEITGLSAATITGITAKLIEGGLVFEKSTGDSSGGRPPILLAINPRCGFVIGIKLMEDRAVGSLTDLNASIESEHTIEFEDKSKDSVVGAILSLVYTLLEKAKLKADSIFGIGVGVAGVVDFSLGILRQNPFFGWENVNLREILQSKLRIPVFIDNDVNTLTVGEIWSSAHPAVDDFLVITIGRGIGLGIVINGQIYRGKSGGAGELGHIVIDPQGPICKCGKRGCLESYLGERAILVEARKTGRQIETIGCIAELAEQQEMDLVNLLSRAGELFGRQVANLVNIFDPKLIVIGGEGVRLGSVFFENMEKAMRDSVMPGLAKDTEIRIAHWGDDIWARGAASLVIGEIFKSPIQKEARG